MGTAPWHQTPLEQALPHVLHKTAFTGARGQPSQCRGVGDGSSKGTGASPSHKENPSPLPARAVAAVAVTEQRAEPRRCHTALWLLLRLLP